MSEPLKKIGDYEVLGVLGSGGMGRVYKVRNSITDRVEAMKVLLPDLQGHEGVAARFLREIKVLAALQHPNIAPLHTALTIDNQLVMVMEYVEGESLSTRLDRSPIPVPEALNFLDQVLSALSYAHQHHVIHRDIKPANMMLTPQGTIKLMDFGIAHTDDESSQLTTPGSTLGSMSYMSPEQIKGEATDERSDLYSLGISFYEMVTGEKPFHGDSNFSLMAAHINQIPRPPVELHPGLPAAVNSIILTSIAKAPEQRFQSADAFRYAVQRALQSVQEERTAIQGSYDSTVAASVAPVQSRPVASSTVKSAIALPPSIIVSPAHAVPAASSHRGLYMGLGALVLLIVLAVAGIYIPSHKKASAAEGVDMGKSQPIMPVVAQPVVVQHTITEKPVTSDIARVPKPTGVAELSATSAKKAISEGAGLQSGNVPNTAPPPANSAELDAIEHEIDQLTSRAAAVDTGLDNLQRQQAAAGYGLRGDMASRQASMKVNLSKAQSAIEHNDPARAKRYSDMTSADVEALEKFLGR